MNLKRNWKLSGQTFSSYSFNFLPEVLGRWLAVAAKQVKIALVMQMTVFTIMIKVLYANRPSPFYLSELQLPSTPRIANCSMLALTLIIMTACTETETSNVKCDNYDIMVHSVRAITCA